MVQRVVMGPLPGGGIGLRVSRPGSNVLDPGLAPKQVAFDSRWLASLRVHMAGAAALPTVAAGGPTSVTTVYFGKTFAVPPLVIVAFTRTTGAIALGTSASGTLLTYTDRFTLSGPKPDIAPPTVIGPNFSYYVLTP